jgi:hypothetical protein
LMPVTSPRKSSGNSPSPLSRARRLAGRPLTPVRSPTPSPLSRARRLAGRPLTPVRSAPVTPHDDPPALELDGVPSPRGGGGGQAVDAVAGVPDPTLLQARPALTLTLVGQALGATPVVPDGNHGAKKAPLSPTSAAASNYELIAQIGVGGSSKVHLAKVSAHPFIRFQLIPSYLSHARPPQP